MRTKRDITLGVLLPPADAERVRRRASAQDRSVSAELRRQLRPYLLDLQKDEGPATSRAPSRDSGAHPEHDSE